MFNANLMSGHIIAPDRGYAAFSCREMSRFYLLSAQATHAWRSQRVYEGLSVSIRQVCGDFLTSEPPVMTAIGTSGRLKFVCRYGPAGERECHRSASDACHCLRRHSLLRTDSGAASPAGGAGDVMQNGTPRPLEGNLVSDLLQLEKHH